MSLRLLPFRRAFAGRQLVRTTGSPQQFRNHASTHTDSGTEHKNPQRDAQKDREKMDAQPNEYAKSGTDSEMAKNKAFDPNSSNDPDQARKEAGKDNDTNPLDASPANQELSSGTSEASGGAGKKLSEGGGGRQGGGDSSGDKHGGGST